MTNSLPTADDCRKMRDESGLGLMECKRHLNRLWMRAEIKDLEQKNPRLAQLLLVMMETL